MTAEFDTFASIWRDGDKSMARDSLGRGDETGDEVNPLQTSLHPPSFTPLHCARPASR